jgi:hypothetical protein
MSYINAGARASFNQASVKPFFNEEKKTNKQTK